MGRWFAFSAAACVFAPLVVALVLPAFGARGSSAAAAGDEDIVSIAWVGDLTLGSSYGRPPERGRALFGRVRERLTRPDLAIANLEGTLSVGGGAKCGTDGRDCFNFQAPPENAAAARWAGLDALNLANNHSIDFGASGLRQTVDALRGQRLAPVGLPGQVKLVARGGVRIALVGFAPYPWANDLRDLAAVRALVRKAAAKADLVIALAHMGAEGSAQTHVPVGREYAMGEDRGDTRAFAHAAIDAGADLVLGSGPHVLRGAEFHRGRLIAYSLGNFAGWHNYSTFGTYALSGLLTVRLSREGYLRGGALTPLRLSGAGVPAPDRSREAVALVNRLGHEDFGRTALRLLPDGSF